MKRKHTMYLACIKEGRDGNYGIDVKEITNIVYKGEFPSKKIKLTRYELNIFSHNINYFSHVKIIESYINAPNFLSNILFGNIYIYIYIYIYRIILS